MLNKKLASYFRKAWKNLKFAAWLLWFFLTWPYQMKKAYTQFINAVSPDPKSERKSLIIPFEHKFYINLN